MKVDISIMIGARGTEFVMKVLLTIRRISLYQMLDATPPSPQIKMHFQLNLYELNIKLEGSPNCNLIGI